MPVILAPGAGIGSRVGVTILLLRSDVDDAVRCSLVPIFEKDCKFREIREIRNSRPPKFATCGRLLTQPKQHAW